MGSEVGVERLGHWAQQSVTLKLLTMGFLLLTLLIPAGMIQSTIRERESRREAAIHEIALKWGGSQTLAGPWLMIPYRTTRLDDKGKSHVDIHQAYFLPESLEAQGSLESEVRYRGIYEAVLYQSDMKLEGRFAAPDFKALNVATENVIWEQARVFFGVTDMRGIRSPIVLKWRGKDHETNPGLCGGLVDSGVSAPVSVTPGSGAEFTMGLKLNGSGTFSFLPLGKITQMRLTSLWPNPSFTGAFLPVERMVTPEGFDATWEVLHVNRNFPQSWVDARPDVQSSAFGVELLVLADQYQKTTRSTKYAVLFILLTFGLFFFVEQTYKRRVHALQYLLVGLAVVFFYSLLVALAEHIGFNAAYAVATFAIVAMVTLYTRSIFGMARIAALTAGLMTGLYLFTLLQMQDYALLMGNLGLFATLALTMKLSSRIVGSTTPSDSR